MPGFYDLDRIEQVAVNLFYGWGYNFYRVENQLRADSLLIRSRVSDLLGAARRSVSEREAEFRRAMPPLSREHPRPDPVAIATASKLEELGREISGLQGPDRRPAGAGERSRHPAPAPGESHPRPPGRGRPHAGRTGGTAAAGRRGGTGRSVAGRVRRRPATACRTARDRDRARRPDYGLMPPAANASASGAGSSNSVSKLNCTGISAHG